MKLKVTIDGLAVFEETANTFNEKRPVIFRESSHGLAELAPLDDHRSVNGATSTHVLTVVPKSVLLDLWTREKLSKESLMSLFGMTPEDLTTSNT